MREILAVKFPIQQISYYNLLWHYLKHLFNAVQIHVIINSEEIPHRAFVLAEQKRRS